MTPTRDGPSVPDESGVFEWARAWSQHLDQQVESEEYLRRIHEWREYWRPAKVRILLIAESHVREQPGDLDVQVAEVRRGQPRGYCRLVYCPGYGESDLCVSTPQPNPGTWQYWDIFGATVGGTANKQPRKSHSSTDERLKWKLHTLETMRARGIWLVDASVAALYVPGGEKPPGKYRDRMIRESFQRFVWPRVENEPLEQVWVIGRDVHRALRGHPAVDPERVISQPRDRNHVRYKRGLERMAAQVLGDDPPVSPWSTAASRNDGRSMLLLGCLELVLLPFELLDLVMDDDGGCLLPGCGTVSSLLWLALTAFCCCGLSPFE